MNDKINSIYAWRDRRVATGYETAESLAGKYNRDNWRLHPEEQRVVVEEGLEAVGWADAIKVNRRLGGNDVLLDGHLRVELALLVDPVMQIPVDYYELSEDEEALVLASLDSSTGLAGTDREKLGALMEKARGFLEHKPNLKGMLERVKASAGVGGGEGNAGADTTPQVDKAAELRDKWGVEPGQLWRLGDDHRLICGDCTDPDVVERLMGGEKAVLCVTDPPYGVSYADKNKWLNTISPGNRIQTEIKNDHADKEATQAMWKAAFCEMEKVMAPGAVVYCFMPQGGDQMMMMMMMGAGIEPRHEIIWLKNNHVLGRVDYAYKHEPIMYAWKAGGHKFYGDFQTSILEYDKPLKSDLHPTMKPVSLLERLVGNSSKVGEVIYEPFCGSGSTIIACENLNRRCRAVEVEPKYVAVALERWGQHTGQQPELIE